jgi:hypothetical protein
LEFADLDTLALAARTEKHTKPQDHGGMMEESEEAILSFLSFLSESMAACAGKPCWKAISMVCPSRSEELRRICLATQLGRHRFTKLQINRNEGELITSGCCKKVFTKPFDIQGMHRKELDQICGLSTFSYFFCTHRFLNVFSMYL